jgi:flagellar biosynthesis/type III secretory pathway ATPase
MPAVTGPDHRAAAARVRRALGRWEAARELVAAGAWVRGADPALDAAAAAMPEVEEFLRQDGTDDTVLDETLEALQHLASRVEE